MVDELEKFRGQDMKDLNVGILRHLATEYRKVLYLSPSDLEGKDKSKQEILIVPSGIHTLYMW